MKPLLALLVASALALAFSLSSSAGKSPRTDAPPAPTPVGSLAPPIPRVHCAAPHALRLDRFEDGSAQVRCAGRILVRVSVPG